MNINFEAAPDVIGRIEKILFSSFGSKFLLLNTLWAMLNILVWIYFMGAAIEMMYISY